MTKDTDKAVARPSMADEVVARARAIEAEINAQQKPGAEGG